ncbi:ABC-F family ATP-binding cassette domain-containing protein [Brachybacterium sacelli]|uniref:ATPase subunit of ABC transporter with duplicated ATPase domains n=1 Tax=Brachybacterium sacelli TaxID=173364 RepID=A0ABS4WXE9_9MICO|nr:ATP-binding cassette domain-containing protein [Brachybacterium sacelli]MBP2380838.1 ATPase subunit of ABC transporter with duplicated ATPase domains [Brachybacterium sacelli]
MSLTQKPAVVLADASFAWPDGTEALTGLTAAFGTGRTGLTGANGTGKTTLLRVIAGELVLTTGTISAHGLVGYLPQQLSLRTGATVAELLGVSERLTAVRALEAGDASAETFDVIADDWDVESRARATLDGMGLATVDLDRPVGTLSGGETVLLALTGLRWAGREIVLLDEPTNNLDRGARHRLYDTITAWRGTLIVVSHDVALLDLMDDTAELRGGDLTVYGGNYTAYQHHVAREQAAAEQALRSAEQTEKIEKRQRIEAQTKLARRRRYARTDFENTRRPKVIMKLRAQEAQVSAGKLRVELDEKIQTAHDAVEEQERRLRREDRIHIDLPDPGVPAGRRLAELHDGRGAPVILQGPERAALTGPNGIGKTRLLETLLTPSPAPGGTVHGVAHTDLLGYLPQRLDHLDDDESVLEAVRAAAPQPSPHEIRAQLARFLLRADAVHRRIGDLSGGERFRAALATLLLAQPPRQLLLLDEPTNNLDLRSIDELVDALDSYRGGVLVVSHDDAFLDRLRIDTWIALGADGLTRE